VISNRQKAEKSGRQAEHYAALYLRLKGYHILEHRFKTRVGEIDLIVRKSDTLAFIEVKRRLALKAAQDSLTYRTRQRITKAAQIYISQSRPAQHLAHRYDAVFIIGRGWGWPSHAIDLWRPQ